MTPLVVTLPTLSTFCSVNHRLPFRTSDDPEWAAGSGRGGVLGEDAAGGHPGHLIRAVRGAHRDPQVAGPGRQQSPTASMPAVGRGNSVMTPAGSTARPACGAPSAMATAARRIAATPTRGQSTRARLQRVKYTPDTR